MWRYSLHVVELVTGRRAGATAIAGAAAGGRGEFGHSLHPFLREDLDVLELDVTEIDPQILVLHCITLLYRVTDWRLIDAGLAGRLPAHTRRQTAPNVPG